MGYSVKWVEDNLGITRDMIRNYERKELLKIDKTRNPKNNYRDFSDEDIEYLWGIKLLIGIGFSAAEIKSFIDKNNSFDFDEEIRKKVAKLEKELEEKKNYLEFAKTIKVTGQIPNVTKIGSMTFKEFYKYARKNWNIFNELPNEACKSFISNIETYALKDSEEWGADAMKNFLEVLSDIDLEEMSSSYTLHGYYQVISNMQDFGYNNEAVQRVVDLVYQHLLNHTNVGKKEEKINPRFMVKQALFFVGGDIALMHEKNYGKDGCKFIAKALAYYGGYDIDEL